MTMSWYEHAIRRYEHRRWTTDDNRMVRSFEWGLEHLNGRPGSGEPREFLGEYASEAIARSEQWYAAPNVSDYRLDHENVVTFTSPLESPWPENNTVHAQFFAARKSGPAVMILPYHARRMAAGHKRADQLVGPNIGLTLQANRQAVLDARACLTWLERQGYDRLGILGTSIGSSVGYITLVHDKRVRAGGFFHVSTYFADVVSQ